MAAIARNAARGLMDEGLNDQREDQPAEVAGHPDDRAGGSRGGAPEAARRR